MKLFTLPLICLLSLSFAKESDALRRIQDQHVEHRSISPMLVRRALKLATESFDPYKIYLSKDELYPLIHLSDKQLSHIAKEASRGDFSGFDPLFALFGKASMRASKWRKEILNEPARQVSLKGSYVESVSALKDQQRAYMAACAEAQGIESASWEKLVGYYDKRLSFHEKSYDLKQWRMKVVKALAKSFDPHTAYYSADQVAELRAYLQKGFQGVGITFRENLDGIFVAGLAPDGPAKASGQIALGDRLIALDGDSVQKACFTEAMGRLSRLGGAVPLTFEREGKVRRVTLSKAPLEIKEGRIDVSYEPVQEGIIGKITLHSFYESSTISAAGDLRFAIGQLKKTGKLQGLVLDLRENPGGFLSQGIKVAGIFMHSGVVAVAKCRDKNEQYLRDLSRQTHFSGPLVILISKASASCSEIVAGALQDYGLGLVVGDTSSFGKATIQDQTLTRTHGAGYRVTMGRYYTVSGRSPQIEGVLSDITVPTHYAKRNMGERYLSYPLASNHTKSAFHDPLADVHPSKRSWLKGHYLPSIQKKRTFWRAMLPQLKENSTKRLATSAAYQEFLQDPNLAKEDLVMREGVEIVKDMVRIRNLP